VDGLRSIGLSSLADEGLKVLNRAAEDAVKEAPIFVDAVTKMSFRCRGILMGNETAATIYLQNSTSTALYGKFNPVKNSFT
jgi:type II secretory pathway component PulC